MAWAKNGSQTLTVAGDDINTGVQTSFNFNFLLSYDFNAGGGDTFTRGKIGNTTIDDGNNYARRFSVNGGTESTGASVPYYGDFAGSSANLTDDQFGVAYLINISGEEKLIIINGMSRNTAGAANAPSRQESVGKWATASGQADIIGVNNSQGGNFDVDSNFTAFGTD